MLGTRILTALIGAPLLLVAAALGGWVLTCVVSLLALLLAREYAGLALPDDRSAAWLLPLAAAAVGLATQPAAASGWPGAWGGIALAALALQQAPRLVGKREPEPAGALAFGFGLVYAAIAPAHLIVLRNGPDGWLLILFVFLITWGTDTGAYAAGAAFGRRPLSPAISPKKSVEGACGGLLTAAVIGLVFAWATPWPFAPWSAPAAALVLAAMVQLGDLFESSLKREAGVKDSGALLPGHGGFLDRFDGLLWAAPAGAYLFFWLHQWTMG